MAPDLLNTIHLEIEERLSELRPLLAEYEQLLAATNALVAKGGENGSIAAVKAPVLAKAPTAKAPTPAKVPTAKAPTSAKAPTPAMRVRRTRAAAKPRPERAARGAAREAILAALDHGSHTVAELSVVTAMSGPNINGNLRKLISEGAVVKTGREGKAAWALAGAV